MQEDKLEQTSIDKPEYKEHTFILGCRYYNLSLAYIRKFKAMYKVHSNKNEN